MDETTAATTIVVDVDQSGVISAISNLSSEISDLKNTIESQAAAQESMLIEVQEKQSRSIDSTDSTAIALLIFIGIILSLCITVFLFRKP